MKGNINTIAFSELKILVEYSLGELGLQNTLRGDIERYFKRATGITPKLFINIVKFTHLNKRIHANNTEDSLLHIMYEMGYYDHSYLTRAFKKFSGLNPSEIGITSPLLIL